MTARPVGRMQGADYSIVPIRERDIINKLPQYTEILQILHDPKVFFDLTFEEDHKLNLGVVLPKERIPHAFLSEFERIHPDLELDVASFWRIVNVLSFDEFFNREGSPFRYRLPGYNEIERDVKTEVDEDDPHLNLELTEENLINIKNAISNSGNNIVSFLEQLAWDELSKLAQLLNQGAIPAILTLEPFCIKIIGTIISYKTTIANSHVESERTLQAFLRLIKKQLKKSGREA